MDIIITISSIILVNLLAWITPGPNMVAVMNASINYGRRSGVFTGFGLAMGATIWAILAVLGVTILFDLFPKAVFLLRVAGAAYLIWLGVKILRSEFSTKTNILPRLN